MDQPQPLDPANRQVFVSQNDQRKDLTDAKRYGQLRDVFSSITRNQDTPRMLSHARRVLQKWNDGDYLLVIGSPALVGVCSNLIGERFGTITYLLWDKNEYRYYPQRWDFDAPEQTD